MPPKVMQFGKDLIVVTATPPEADMVVVNAYPKSPLRSVPFQCR
jgi:hypothetical protein